MNKQNREFIAELILDKETEIEFETESASTEQTDSYRLTEEEEREIEEEFKKTHPYQLTHEESLFLDVISLKSILKKLKRKKNTQAENTVLKLLAKQQKEISDFKKGIKKAYKPKPLKTLKGELQELNQLLKLISK